MNGSVIGTLSEERIREICQQNCLDSAGEEIVIEIMREIDKEVDDPEKDMALVKERTKVASDPNMILDTIIDITNEFVMKKKCLSSFIQFKDIV